MHCTDAATGGLSSVRFRDSRARGWGGGNVSGRLNDDLLPQVRGWGGGNVSGRLNDDLLPQVISNGVLVETEAS